MEHTGYFTYETVSLLYLIYRVTFRFLKIRNGHFLHLDTDFLRCIAASEALMKFEDIRITRDFRNNLTRLDNCELANEVKTIAAATKQVDDITLLQEVSMLDHMDEKFKVVGYMRLNHPEASLTEMTEIYEAETGQAISKSGIAAKDFDFCFAGEFLH